MRARIAIDELRDELQNHVGARALTRTRADVATDRQRLKEVRGTLNDIEAFTWVDEVIKREL